MRAIIYIYITLIFFVYIIICSILYINVIGYLDKRFNKKVEALKENFGKDVLQELENIKKHDFIEDEKIEYFKKKIRNKHYEQVFNDILAEFNEDPKNKKITTSFMQYFNLYINTQIKKYNKKAKAKQIYIVYLLGEYGVDYDYINEFLLNELDTKSIYLRFNAFKSISNIGNVHYFMRALKSLSQSQAYLNEKILIDIIGQFAGDKGELNCVLMAGLNDFSVELQCIVIDHFKNHRDKYFVATLLDKLVNDSTHKEVKASIIKYFSVVSHEKAINVLINLTQDSEWELRALAAKALSNYYSEETVKVLLGTITDENWYVRLNSAMSLLEFKNTETNIEKVFEMNDRYSRDIMLYALFVKKRISYEYYLERTQEEVEVATC